MKYKVKTYLKPTTDLGRVPLKFNPTATTAGDIRAYLIISSPRRVVRDHGVVTSKSVLISAKVFPVRMRIRRRKTGASRTRGDGERQTRGEKERKRAPTVARWGGKVAARGGVVDLCVALRY